MQALRRVISFRHVLNNSMRGTPPMSTRTSRRRPKGLNVLRRPPLAHACTPLRTCAKLTISDFRPAPSPRGRVAGRLLPGPPARLSSSFHPFAPWPHVTPQLPLFLAWLLCERFTSFYALNLWFARKQKKTQCFLGPDSAEASRRI